MAVFALVPKAAADPIQITSGFVAVGGVQDLFSRGFLRAIVYDFSTPEFTLVWSESDGVPQNYLSPRLVTPSEYTTPDGTTRLVAVQADWLFSATPALAPTPFTVSGTLSIVDHATGAPLFSSPVFGSGNVAWLFVTTPGGGSVVSGATYAFTDTPPVPEPATMLLIGTGLAGIALRRRRASGRPGA